MSRVCKQTKINNAVVFSAFQCHPTAFPKQDDDSEIVVVFEPRKNFIWVSRFFRVLEKRKILGYHFAVVFQFLSACVFVVKTIYFMLVG